MSKKHLDTSALVNELSGNSVFFQRKPPTLPHATDDVPSKPITTPQEENGRTAERPADRMAKRSNDRTAAWPHGRRVIRHGFDIFDDQLQALKDIQRNRERRHNKNVTLGQLAQEALEQFVERELKQRHR